mgnify:FL=1
MINYNSLMLKNWIEENSDFLTGARIQKIQQPTRRDFVFVIRNKGESRKFYININPQYYHVCFMSKENELKRFIEIPQKPPMFCMLLRKYLENAVISHVEQPEFERILEFYIETYNELSEKIYLCLAIELMGKYSNVILYNYDTNIILGCAHNVGAEKSREREMAGGLPYVYPSGRPNSWYCADKNILPSEIDSYYAQIISDDKIKRVKSDCAQIVNKKIKKDKTSLKKIQSANDKDYDKYRLYGDLIMANLYNNKDYLKTINVYDYENNCEISIELDETKTLKDNANRYYKLYNKSKTAHEKMQEMSLKLKENIEYNEQILYSLELANDMDELLEIKSEIEPEKQVKSTKKVMIEPLQIEGFDVYVGKNNRQNDYIVSKLSKDEDLWFHTRDCAGSHVLLKCENPSDKLIFECAKLAKKYSKGSLSSKVSVIYTKRKYLKKPPKANLGYVIYKCEQEILV